MIDLKCRFSLFLPRLVGNFNHPLESTEETKHPPNISSFTTQKQRLFIKRNRSNFTEIITSGTPFTLVPILISHSKNPSKRETNNKSALALKET